MKRILVALTLVALALPTPAQDAAPAAVDTHVQSVALFKNGMGFFVRTGELPRSPAGFEIGPLPAAVHGTLWLGWADGAQLADLRSHTVAATETRDAVSLEELIRANVGERVRLWWLSDREKPMTGRIIPVPEAPVRDDNPYLAILPPDRRPPESANLAMIETRDGVVAIYMNRLSHIIFLDQPSTEVPIDEKHVMLSGRYAAGPAGGPLSVSYLAGGMTWAPSYMVDISDPERALLTAKAVVINEVEDLENAHVDLVTGFPYLEYSQIISPLARKEDLAAFIRALQAGASGRGRMAHGVAAQVGAPAGPRGPYMAEVAMPDYGAAAAGVAVEDLFFYPIEDVTLARGETGYFPLFSRDVPYEHVYTWDLPNYIDDQSRYRQPGDEREQIVWHSLRLTNEMALPWTTAPAQTVSEGLILGQATLKYTPRGADTTLRITQAMEIRAEELEVEVEREANAATFHGVRYDRVTIDGTLTMRSHLDREVTVEVTKLLSGEVRESAPEAEVVKLAAGLQGVNPRSQLTWELELPAGETVEMTYTYQVFIRN